MTAANKTLTFRLIYQIYFSILSNYPTRTIVALLPSPFSRVISESFLSFSHGETGVCSSLVFVRDPNGMIILTIINLPLRFFLSCALLQRRRYFIHPRSSFSPAEVWHGASTRSLNQDNYVRSGITTVSICRERRSRVWGRSC